MDEWIEVKNDPVHAAREREKARALRKSQWWKQLLANGVCHYCGKKYPPEELTMDHIVPVARGGRSVKGNVVPCCKDCNNKKKYLTPAEMIMQELEKENPCAGESEDFER